MSDFLKTIAPAVPVLGSVIDTVAAQSSAKKAQKRQMAWDEKFWNMQNKYNSPQEQMKRLQEAGLNPNLVYGGSPAQSAGSAERIKTPDLAPAGTKPIDTQGAMSTLGGYADFDVKQAQTDNLKANTQVAQETALFKAIQSYGEGLRNHRTKFDLNLVEDLRSNTMEMAKENLRKQRLDNEFKITGEARSAATHVQNLIQQKLGHSLTAAQTKNLQADNELKELDKKLAAMGVRPSDPFYVSAIARFVEIYLKKLGK